MTRSIGRPWEKGQGVDNRPHMLGKTIKQLLRPISETDLNQNIGSMPPFTLAFHAERLHAANVWKETERVAAWMAEHDMRATFFVYPFPAAVASKNINKRLQWLGSLGHEIAQHTHFYAGTKIAKHEKRDDLTKANLTHCVRRDFEALIEAGSPPKAFTAGAWFINDAVLDTLIELGFVYDCSARFPGPKSREANPNDFWLTAPQYYSNAHGRILCLPTTCSLGEWFKWGHKAGDEQGQFYQIVYLHDYDLLSLKRSFLLSCFLKLVLWKVVGQSVSLAGRCIFQEELSHDRKYG
jgi:polysaccharide deacetylase